MAICEPSAENLKPIRENKAPVRPFQLLDPVCCIPRGIVAKHTEQNLRAVLFLAIFLEKQSW